MPADTTSTTKTRAKLTALVGCNIGGDRFEAGDTIPADRLSAATRSAWLEQGLIDDGKKKRS